MTGYGPFGHHTVNASWVAVQELSHLWEQREVSLKSYVLDIHEIPVAYSYVLESLPDMYRKLSPILCIHVGVAPYTMVKLERCGRNSGYRCQDIHKQCPTANQCVLNGPEEIKTQFDLENVCKLLSSYNKTVEFGISEDAGRYLCDFIYYKSLSMEFCPVLFVHVPSLDNPYSSKELGQALKDLVEVLLMELKSTTV